MFGMRGSARHFPSRLWSRNVVGPAGRAIGVLRCIQARAEKAEPKCPRYCNDAGIHKPYLSEPEKTKCTYNESWRDNRDGRPTLARSGGATPPNIAWLFDRPLERVVRPTHDAVTDRLAMLCGRLCR